MRASLALRLLTCPLVGSVLAPVPELGQDAAPVGRIGRSPAASTLRTAAPVRGPGRRWWWCAHGSPDDPTLGFADSIAAGHYASFTVPLLLTESREFSPQVRDYLIERANESPGGRLRHIDVVGGPEAVGDRVVETDP